MSRPRRLARFLASVAGASAFAVTLMACYGAMPKPADYAQGPNCEDADGDGVCVPQDCNDTDPTITPGASDTDGDAIDQNCDGVDGWRDPAEVAEPATAEPAPTE